MAQEQEVIAEIKKEIDIYKSDDKQDKYTKYTEKDLRELISDIDFLLENNRCSNCKKLVTCGDYDNFECSNCGVSLSETFNVKQNDEAVN